MEPTKIEAFLESLDHKSRQILEYIAKNNGHGSIRELTRLIDASSDMDVLIRIREVINKSARKIFGRNALRFEERRIDKATGKIMTFHWWLDEKLPVVTTDAEILDEGDSLRVVVARGMPDTIKAAIEGRTLFLSDGACQRKIELPCMARNPKTGFKNGVVEVKMDKIVWRK